MTFAEWWEKSDGGSLLSHSARVAREAWDAGYSEGVKTMDEIMKMQDRTDWTPPERKEKNDDF